MGSHRDFARKQEGSPKENLQTPSLMWPRRNFFSSYLPFPLGRRPKITRVLQLLLQLSEPLPCFLKTRSRASPSNPRTSGPEPAPKYPSAPAPRPPSPEIAEYLRLWVCQIRGLPKRFDSKPRRAENKRARKPDGRGQPLGRWKKPIGSDVGTEMTEQLRRNPGNSER